MSSEHLKLKLDLRSNPRPERFAHVVDCSFNWHREKLRFQQPGTCTTLSEDINRQDLEIQEWNERCIKFHWTLSPEIAADKQERDKLVQQVNDYHRSEFNDIDIRAWTLTLGSSFNDNVGNRSVLVVLPVINFFQNIDNSVDVFETENYCRKLLPQDVFNDNKVLFPIAQLRNQLEEEIIDRLRTTGCQATRVEGDGARESPLWDIACRDCPYILENLKRASELMDIRRLLLSCGHFAWPSYVKVGDWQYDIRIHDTAGGNTTYMLWVNALPLLRKFELSRMRGIVWLGYRSVANRSFPISVINYIAPEPTFRLKFATKLDEFGDHGSLILSNFPLNPGRTITLNVEMHYLAPRIPFGARGSQLSSFSITLISLGVALIVVVNFALMARYSTGCSA